MIPMLIGMGDDASQAGADAGTAAVPFVASALATNDTTTSSPITSVTPWGAVSQLLALNPAAAPKASAAPGFAIPSWAWGLAAGVAGWFVLRKVLR